MYNIQYLYNAWRDELNTFEKIEYKKQEVLDEIKDYKHFVSMYNFNKAVVISNLKGMNNMLKALDIMMNELEKGCGNNE